MSMRSHLFILLAGVSMSTSSLMAHGGEDHAAMIPKAAAVVKGAHTSVLFTRSAVLPQVGQLTDLAFSVTDTRTKKPVTLAKARLSIELLEDKLVIFEAPFFIKDGSLKYGYGFMDGSDHRLTLSVWRSSGAEPETFSWTVQVEALQPPRQRVAFTLAFLAVLVLVGMGLGLWMGQSPEA